VSGKGNFHFPSFLIGYLSPSPTPPERKKSPENPWRLEPVVTPGSLKKEKMGKTQKP
jgi:hypothetical protein